MPPSACSAIVPASAWLCCYSRSITLAVMPDWARGSMSSTPPAPRSQLPLWWRLRLGSAFPLVLHCFWRRADFPVATAAGSKLGVQSHAAVRRLGVLCPSGVGWFGSGGRVTGWGQPDGHCHLPCLSARGLQCFTLHRSHRQGSPHICTLQCSQGGASSMEAVVPWQREVLPCPCVKAARRQCPSPSALTCRPRV